MKKVIIGLMFLGMLVACTQDEYVVYEPIGIIPETLQIVEPIGLKLENTFVSDKVSVNVKLPSNGTYRLKIKDIIGNLVSQEKLSAKEGDNILSIYTTSLEKSSYTVELQTEDGILLGSSVFVMVKLKKENKDYEKSSIRFNIIVFRFMY